MYAHTHTRSMIKYLKSIEKQKGDSEEQGTASLALTPPGERKLKPQAQD
jgi:hypothetical protein